MKTFVSIVLIGLLFLCMSAAISAQTNYSVCLDDDPNEPELTLTAADAGSPMTYIDVDPNEPE
jgi:hypothetical protein